MTERPSESEPWTLERVERDLPDLAPLARLHRAIEDAIRAFEKDAPFHPDLPGTPGVHWLQGTSLLDAVRQDPLVARLPGLFAAIADAVGAATPAARGAVDQIAAATSGAPFDWAFVLAHFRDPQWVPATPHPHLTRFLVLRTISVPARHLARSWSAPHPDRWKRSRCPFCGVGAAASVARTGSGRTLLCVLCGGRWETADTICTGCGETNLERFRVFANREAGPASIESCVTCGTSIKVFSSGDATWGPPLALEVATVRLDLLAERDERAFRDTIALASLFPPE